MLSRSLPSSASSSKVLATIMISKIIIPESLSQNLREYSEHLIPKNSTPRRDVSSLDIAKLQPDFNQIVRKYPNFLEQLLKNFHEQSKIINIKGLDFPTIPLDEIPKTGYLEDYEKKMVSSRDMAICKISTALMMGLVVDLKNEKSIFELIYPTKEGQGNSKRFDGDKDLGWHNDGWLRGVHDLVILAGVKGHEAVKTKVVLTQQIIDYFKKEGKEAELEVLMRDMTIADNRGDFEYERGKIIDPTELKVRFSEYGAFGEHDGSVKEREALRLLKQFLQEIDPVFSESIQKGEILIIQNPYALHAKHSSKTIKAGERLLLRYSHDAGEGGLRKGLPPELVENPSAIKTQQSSRVQE